MVMFSVPKLNWSENYLEKERISPANRGEWEQNNEKKNLEKGVGWAESHVYEREQGLSCQITHPYPYKVVVYKINSWNLSFLVS